MVKRVRSNKTEEPEVVQEIPVEPVQTIERSETGVIRWKKVHGGSLRLGNQIIKPGQIFKARRDEIPDKFMNSVQAMDAIPESEIEKAEPVKSVYTLKERGNNWYDVVNKEGKPLNEKALRLEQANELLKSL